MSRAEFSRAAAGLTLATAAGLGVAACSSDEVAPSRHTGVPDCEDKFTVELEGYDYPWAEKLDSGMITVKTYDRLNEADGQWSMERPRSEELADGDEEAWKNLSYAVGCLVGEDVEDYTVWARESFPNPSPDEDAARQRAEVIAERASEELDIPLNTENNGTETVEVKSGGSIQILFVEPSTSSTSR